MLHDRSEIVAQVFNRDHGSVARDPDCMSLLLGGTMGPLPLQRFRRHSRLVGEVVDPFPPRAPEERRAHGRRGRTEASGGPV